MNILLIVVDCLRADRVIGHRSCQTPVIDRLASDSMVCSQAVASAVFTTPSFATLLTGNFQPRHGVHHLAHFKLTPILTLPEYLRAHGYHTHAEVTGPLLPEVGLDRGFDSYVFREITHDNGAWWGRLPNVLAALRSPWFALIHIWDVHRPRWTEPQFRSSAFGRTRYDRAISMVDSSLPLLLNRMSSQDLVVFTGDHGERPEGPPGLAFVGKQAAHLLPLLRRAGLPCGACETLRRVLNTGHGALLYDDLIRIPLIFHGQKVLRSARRDLVSHVDVFPTILDWVGLPIPDQLAGHSLLRPPVAGRATYLEALRPEGRFFQGVRTEAHKYLRYADPPHDEMLFDLVRDPGERWNRARRLPERVASLRRKLDALAADAVLSIAMSAEEEAVVEKRLRDLGYLE